MKRFISLVLNNPYKVAITFLILSFFSTISILNNLSINTSTNSLIDNNLQFKKNQKKLKDNFKVLNNNVLVRIKGNNSNNVNLTYQSIIKRIESREEFNFFYSPNFDKFFQENFFFMLNDEQKSDFINQLYEFQPFLSEMNNNPKLEGFNNFIELLIENKMFDELENLTYVFKNFLKSLENNKKVDWKGILKQDLNEIYILISVDQNYLDKNGFDQTYNFFGEIVKNFSSENLDIEFTGGLVLDYEEIGSVSSGVLFSGFLSLLLVAVILFAALKELRLILSLILSIIIGLIITTGITSLTVGSLNLISVAFAVLFIGLSVDFGIQIFLRILENNNKKKDFLKSELVLVSKTISIASVPSIMGFLSFVPTKYIGLSELGIISAIGLIVGLLVNIIFLPSIYLIMNVTKRSDIGNIQKFWYSFGKFILEKKVYFLSFLFIITIFNCMFFKSIVFDSDAMKVKDQTLQSVILAKELIAKNPTSDYIISILVDEKINKDDLDKLLNDPNIKRVKSLENIFTDYRSENLDYLKFLLQTGLSKEFYSQPKEIKRFSKLLENIVSLKLIKLSEVTDSLAKEISNVDLTPANIKIIENLLFSNFNELNDTIISIGNEKNINTIEIPEYFKKRFTSENEIFRYEVLPSKDVTINSNLKDFVKSVQSQFPQATGMPVVQIEAGKIVVDSFVYAFIFSFFVTFLYLLIIFRKIYYVLQCIGSLLIALTLLIFLMIIFKINLNFANMISLPLLFSLGISYPIYFLRRYSEMKGTIKVFNSNTPLAILTSSLTTIASFGTLYLSSHDGTSSMGLLLFLSLLTTLISSLVFLPIFTSFIKSR